MPEYINFDNYKNFNKAEFFKYLNLIVLPLAITITIIFLGDTLINRSVLNSENQDGYHDHGSNYFDKTAKNFTAIGSPHILNSELADFPKGALPVGGYFTAKGKGTWHVVPGITNKIGVGTKHVFTYVIEVEDGLKTVDYGGDEAFARMVDITLANPKSWIHNTEVAFQRVDPDIVIPDFKVSLTSQRTLRIPCQYDIPLETSCFNPVLKRVIINESRWVRGALTFEGDIGSYRQYAINHEIGHAIGFIQHEPCYKNGGLAPIMMQQTIDIRNDIIHKIDPLYVPDDGLICKVNAWPFP